MRPSSYNIRQEQLTNSSVVKCSDPVTDNTSISLGGYEDCPGTFEIAEATCTWETSVTDDNDNCWLSFRANAGEVSMDSSRGVRATLGDIEVLRIDSSPKFLFALDDPNSDCSLDGVLLSFRLFALNCA